MPYTYQVSDGITIDWLSENMPQFLFPDLSKQRTRIVKPLLGILAVKGKQPVGLILASAEKTQTVYRIHSFLVDPAFHGQKIGTNLLQKLEKNIQERGGQVLEGVYRGHWQSLPAIQQLLKTCQWTDPQPQLVMMKGKIDSALAYFSKFSQISSTFSFFNFTQLKKSDLKYIQKRQASSQWFDPDLHPFLVKESIHPAISLLIKKEEKIIGWLVAHRLTQDLVEYTSLFIDKKHRTFKLAYTIIQHALKKQQALGIPKFLITSKMDGNAIAKLLLRAGEHYPVQLVKTFYSQKKLE